MSEKLDRVTGRSLEVLRGALASGDARAPLAALAGIFAGGKLYDGLSQEECAVLERELDAFCGTKPAHPGDIQ